jgi:hypothetical protein
MLHVFVGKTDLKWIHTLPLAKSEDFVHLSACSTILVFYIIKWNSFSNRKEVSNLMVIFSEIQFLHFLSLLPQSIRGRQKTIENKCLVLLLVPVLFQGV